MARSLSHTAYMAYAKRAAQGSPPPERARPEGELVWAHAIDTERAEALSHIADRLAQLRPKLSLMITLPPDVAPPRQVSDRAFCLPVPGETVMAAEAFLDHWSPDLCLWTGGMLRPALLTCADDRGVPLFLLDADETHLDRTGWRWFPNLPRNILRRFAQIQCRSDEAARGLRRLGVPDEDIIVTGPLRREAVPLSCNTTERDEIAQALLGRPVWLAAHLRAPELDIVLAAHRKVSRLSHRLVLIISPQDEADKVEIESVLRTRDLRLVHWSDGQMPTETTQIILGEGGQDLGLWYRLAPMCLMGNSLIPGMTGSDPGEAAVLGSAILYGPNVRTYIQDYSRFAEGRAARIVRDAETLAAALEHLIAPDRSAAMVHAAWDIASQGAEVTDRILALVQDTLDVLEEG